MNGSDLEPLILNKFNAFTFGYRMTCNAKVVLVKAYGFCPTVTNNTTIQMHLTVIHWSDEGRSTHDMFLEAECNSKINRYNYSSGSVSKDNLNISVSSGDFLAVKYFKNCSSKTCLFHPAFIRKKGSLPAYLTTNNSNKSCGRPCNYSHGTMHTHTFHHYSYHDNIACSSQQTATGNKCP